VARTNFELCGPLRRRSAAVQQGGAQSKNWQAAESQLAASEEKEKITVSYRLTVVMR
jgi:hypothetical protein